MIVVTRVKYLFVQFCWFCFQRQGSIINCSTWEFLSQICT